MTVAALLAVCVAMLPGHAGADDQQSLTISGPATVPEGETATYTIKLSDGTDPDATVDVAVIAADGTEAADFAASPGNVLVPTGADGATFTVRANHDTTDEPGEAFTVQLSNSVRATIATGSVTTTIDDDDGEPSIQSISDVAIPEGNTGTTAGAVRVTLSAPSEKAVTVPYATAPGTAGPDDFVTTSGNLVIPAGATSGDISIAVKGDTIFDPDEKFSVVITDPVNAAPGPDNLGEVTIVDDDAALVPTIAQPAEVAEGNTGEVNLVFKVTLAGPRPATTFNYRTVAGSANANDYVEVGGAQVSFPAGTDPFTRDVPISIKVDTRDEEDESFTLELFDPTTGALVASAVGTILNDDANSQLAIGDASVDEPGSGQANLTFAVTLDPVSDRQVTVNWGTADGTAAAGSDYTTASGSLIFEPGQTSQEVVVPVLGDLVNEENETLVVNLSDASRAGVADAQAQGTIIDKNAPPSLSVSDTSIREGEGATFTVTLAGTTLRTVTVRFNTADGLAKAGSDYNARVGMLTFAPGEKTKDLEVTVVDDTVSETTEDFFMRLGDAVNATITKASGRATIEPSDQAATAAAPRPPVATPAAKKTPVKVLAPRMVLGPRTVQVGANGLARMLVTCQQASPITCAGTLQLERAAKPLLTLGKKTFSVRKGKKAYAPIKLTPRALAILRRGGTMRAKVIVVYKKTVGTGRAVPGTVTLKATKVKAKTTKPAPSPPKVAIDP